MASALYGHHLLTEEDIPKSFLAGRKPLTLKNIELNFWLRCRDELVQRSLNKSPACKKVRLTHYLGTFAVCVM